MTNLTRHTVTSTERANVPSQAVVPRPALPYDRNEIRLRRSQFLKTLPDSHLHPG
jgi:hypothetical protein